MVTTRLAAWYFALQAVALVLWWPLLALWPAFRRVFEMGDPAVLLSFLPSDVVLALACAVTARLAAVGHRAAVPVAGVAVGVVACSTVATCWAVAAAGAGGVGVVAMACATVGSAVSLRALHRGAR